jgi:carbonic anhydrase
MKNKWIRPSLFAGFIAAVLFTSGCQSSKNPEGASVTGMETDTGSAVSAPTIEAQAAMTPQTALADLKAGNGRFVSGHPAKRDLAADVRATASGQHPRAVVLSCLDSRQPIEIMLDQGIGDIFSARVAGNVLNDDILGSMEYACKVSGARLIAVIGHSNCGAIKGAVDDVHLGNLTGLLARIQPVISQIPASVEPRNSKNHEFVDDVAEANVRLVMQKIREHSPILREMIDQGQVGLTGGMYDVSIGEVRFFTK